MSGISKADMYTALLVGAAALVAARGVPVQPLAFGHPSIGGTEPPPILCVPSPADAPSYFAAVGDALRNMEGPVASAVGCDKGPPVY